MTGEFVQSETFYMSKPVLKLYLSCEDANLSCITQNVTYSLELVSSVNEMYNIKRSETATFCVNKTDANVCNQGAIKEFYSWGWNFISLTELNHAYCFIHL